MTREDIAFLQYTGGTTGVAKGAMLTHRNILANLEQTGVWISGSFKEGAEIVIAPLPLYHIFCLTSTLSFMKWGSLIVLITNPRDMPAFVKELGQWKWSVMTGVNTLFNGLLNTPGFDQLDFSALKVVVGGGAAVQKPVAERWQQVTGHYITEAYGLTEASPGVCANPLGTPWNGTIGLPFPSTDVSIRDDDFNELPAWTGEGDIEKHTGEICVRGPQVMKGYWNNPAETAKVMQDGWLKTGDVGHLDADGYFTITDRKKDMILVSGFNVYPNEIESVVATHPGVLECGVGGRARREVGRGGEGGDRQEGSEPHEGGRDRALQDPAHRLQAAAPRGVPRRAAEDADRQGPAARTARRAEGVAVRAADRRAGAPKRDAAFDELPGRLATDGPACARDQESTPGVTTRPGRPPGRGRANRGRAPARRGKRGCAAAADRRRAGTRRSGGAGSR